MWNFCSFSHLKPVTVFTCLLLTILNLIVCPFAVGYDVFTESFSLYDLRLLLCVFSICTLRTCPVTNGLLSTYRNPVGISVFCLLPLFCFGMILVRFFPRPCLRMAIYLLQDPQNCWFSLFFNVRSYHLVALGSPRWLDRLGLLFLSGVVLLELSLPWVTFWLMIHFLN